MSEWVNTEVIIVCISFIRRTFVVTYFHIFSLNKSGTMFLQLNHQKLEVYKSTRDFVNECYKLTRALPAEERYNLVSQIRRAALSVHLNLAEGASRRSLAERKRFYEISRGSIIEIDTALGIVFDLKYCTTAELQPTGDSLLRSFKLLSLLINKT
jgi:four helix bundle protein